MYRNFCSLRVALVCLLGVGGDSVKLLLAGAPRTGTQAIVAAFDRLGYNTLHTGWRRDVRNEWCKHFRYNGSLEDALQTLRGYDVVADEPVMHAHKEIMARFPDAKIILSVRDNATVWYDSVYRFRKQHRWDCIDCGAGSQVLKRLRRLWTSDHKLMTYSIQEECQKTEASLFGCDWYTPQTPEVRGACVEGYRGHIRRVVSATPPGRLLVFNVKEGWGPLCEFLGVPVPDEPFPRLDPLLSSPPSPSTALCNALLPPVLAAAAAFALGGCCCYFSPRGRARRGAARKKVM